MWDTRFKDFAQGTLEVSLDDIKRRHRLKDIFRLGHTTHVRPLPRPTQLHCLPGQCYPAAQRRVMHRQMLLCVPKAPSTTFLEKHSMVGRWNAVVNGARSPATVQGALEAEFEWYAALEMAQ